MAAPATSTFTQKERLLLSQIKQTFHDLGPEALHLMELIVTKSDKVMGPLAKRPISPSSVPSLRGMERFFANLTDSEVVYWRVRPTEKDDREIVPADVCAGDPLFRNDYHVVPVHIFASLARMATQWQKRYVDNFGRRTKAADWPFPTTLCQSNCFAWLFSEQILQRNQLLERTRSRKRAREQDDGPRKRHKSDLGDSIHNQPVGMPTKDKPKELYLYNYPKYIKSPPMEGAGPNDPRSLLPLMSSSTEVVERHYLDLVEKLLFRSTFASDPSFATVVIPLSQLPLMCSSGDSDLPQQESVTREIASHREELFTEGDLPAFLFGRGTLVKEGAPLLPLMTQQGAPGSMSSSSAPPPPHSIKPIRRARAAWQDLDAAFVGDSFVAEPFESRPASVEDDMINQRQLYDQHPSVALFSLFDKPEDG